jgi:hypothetical protein
MRFYDRSSADPPNYDFNADPDPALHYYAVYSKLNFYRSTSVFVSSDILSFDHRKKLVNFYCGVDMNKLNHCGYVTLDIFSGGVS